MSTPPPTNTKPVVKPVHIHSSNATAARKAKIATTPKYPAGIITLQVLGIIFNI